MIPVSLEFSGLNSYRDQQSIDFTQLMSQGLFGIFGVTGAGKSTVLDAMTLALFGQVNRAPRQTQGIINAREKRCRVRFVFELSGRRYEAERVFERTKGEPYSCTAKSCRLVEDGARVLADKNRVMDEEIVRLLNMDCRRFCQTVILPQGQFDQLLHMKPTERSHMLEELFHYQDYGEALVRRCREQLRQAETEVGNLDALLCQLGPCTPEDLERLRQELDAARENVSLTEQRLQAAEDERRRLEELAGLARQRGQLQQELEVLSAEAPRVKALREEEEQARRAEPLRDLLKQAVDLNSRAAEAEQARTQAEAGLQAAEAAHGQAEAARQEQAEAGDRLKQEAEPRLRLLGLAELQRQAALTAKQEWQQAEAQMTDTGLADRTRELRTRTEQLKARREQASDELARLRQQEEAALAGWQQALAADREARRLNAAALLAAGLREGEPCPVCGSLHHTPLTHVTADLQAAEAAEQRAKAEWERLQRARARQEELSADLERQERDQAAELQQKESELNRLQAEASARQQAFAEQDARWRQQAGCEDPAAEQARLEERLQRAARQAQQAEQALQEAKSRLDQAVLRQKETASICEERSSRLTELREQLLDSARERGFASANEARKALRDGERRQELADRIRDFDDKLLRQEQEFSRLNDALRDFDPAAVAPARQQAEALNEQHKELLGRIGGLEHALQKAEEDAERAAVMAGQRSQTAHRADVLRRLSNLLKGNAFVRYLARGTMLELAHESSGILLDLTAGRYRLELAADDSGDFVLVDNNGGLKRQISGLSGGETFLVSLALALALSGKIQMHAAPLGFFFLDEGFGSLDGASLEAAMAVLEKLPSSKRAVGLITHVREVRERVPRYLEVLSDPVRGSRIEMRKN